MGTRKRKLKHPPLVEAIVEVKWALSGGSVPGIGTDPHYPLMLGKFHNHVAGDYPFHQQLDAAKIPDEVTPHVVKHRFRVGDGQWPLIQIGPGILSVNDTETYQTYKEFRPRAIGALRALVETYPPGELRFESFLLRYINAVHFDCASQNVWEHVTDSMHIPMSLPGDFYLDGTLEDKPSTFSWRASFRCKEPPGTATLLLATGTQEREPALIWELVVQSEGTEIADMPEGFASWLDAAHDVVSRWFWTLIEGELVEALNSE